MTDPNVEKAANLEKQLERLEGRIRRIVAAREAGDKLAIAVLNGLDPQKVVELAIHYQELSDLSYRQEAD